MSDTSPAKHNTNLSDIARALGVSSATVSNALSGKGRVSPNLISRVKEMADRLGYVPSQAGRALRTGRNGVLGLVLPDIANPLFPHIAQAVEAAAVSAGYGILIGDSRGAVDLQTAAINRLIERGVDGLVIVPRRGTRIADMDIPVAVIDSPSTPGNTVAADHWQGGELVGAHLAMLGHRKILLLGKNPASIVQSDRIGGIKAGLGCALGQRADIEVLWIEHHEERYGSGTLLGLKEKIANGVTAIAAVSDVHALRAMTELYHSGYQVPSDVCVIGFDDLFWAPYGGIGGSRKYLIASLDQSLKRMGLDYVDIFYSHRVDATTPLEETMGALAHLHRQGKALYVGISSYSPELTRKAAAILKEERVPLFIHQPNYNMFNRWIENGLLDTLGDLGTGCIAFSPLAQGLLTSRYLNGVPEGARAAALGGSLLAGATNEEILGRIRALNAIAERRGQTLAQMAIAWSLRDPRVTSSLIGASSVTQLENSLGALDNLAFSAEELAEIDQYAKDGGMDWWKGSTSL